MVTPTLWCQRWAWMKNFQRISACIYQTRPSSSNRLLQWSLIVSEDQGKSYSQWSMGCTQDQLWDVIMYIYGQTQEAPPRYMLHQEGLSTPIFAILHGVGICLCTDSQNCTCRSARQASQSFASNQSDPLYHDLYLVYQLLLPITILMLINFTIIPTPLVHLTVSILHTL